MCAVVRVCFTGRLPFWTHLFLISLVPSFDRGVLEVCPLFLRVLARLGAVVPSFDQVVAVAWFFPRAVAAQYFSIKLMESPKQVRSRVEPFSVLLHRRLARALADLVWVAPN